MRPRAAPARRGAKGRRPGPQALALATAGLLLAAAFLVEPIGFPYENVQQWLPPLSAHLDPAAGIGLPLALVVGVVVVGYAPRAVTARWSRVLAGTWLATVAWGFSLALLRGWSGGIAAPLANEDEYLVDVDRVHDVGELLRTYTDYILLTADNHWTTHNSGHPPLPLLFYAGLDHIGLGGSAASGVVTALIGSTGVVAVLVTLRALGDEARARTAAPFLALTPLVIWTVVSADGAFMAVVAWGLALLAHAATSVRRGRQALLAALAGLVLGVGIFLSYGLVLMGTVAVAVLLAAHTWRPLAPAVLAALAVVAAFALAGFWWLEGQQVLVERYYQGKGAVRPYGYWVWANLSVAAFTLGPAAVAGLGVGASRLRGSRPAAWLAAGTPAGWLAAGAVVAILAADLSSLSKSEVERIWLPFTVWLVPLTAWLAGQPGRPARRWLVAQALWALAVGIVFRTTW